MARNGFTLIELLIVISIIMILLGLLFPIFSMVRNQAMRTKCRTLIHQVDAACDIYRNLDGTYPDSALISSTFLSTPTAKPPNVTAITAAQWSTIADELLSRLQTVDRERFATVTRLLDPWKEQPLHYRPNQYYPYNALTVNASDTDTKGIPIVIDSDNPPKPDSYQLWSCGQDGIDNQGQAGSDDITDWSSH